MWEESQKQGLTDGGCGGRTERLRLPALGLGLRRQGGRA